ncbi:MAG TPA: ABC transporter ATP-binding protein [Nitrososphaera sp.]|nr:ABC transporter ATP-binding protein [Nitrososphaera sp.]
MNSSVSIKGLQVRLDGQDILKEISAEIPSGKIVGLLGPSGAGKTTLLRVIVGRQGNSAGEVVVLGRPAGAAGLRKEVGYMTQGGAVYTDLTVRENVRFFAAMLGFGKKEAEAMIAKVDLTPQAKQLVSTLSGGQKSRVSLAVALLGEPKLLVLDEPTVGIDPVLREQLWHAFREIAADGTTLIVSSHVMDEASRCDELLLIRDGELLAQAAPQELQRRTHTATVEESFLKLVGDNL